MSCIVQRHQQSISMVGYFVGMMAMICMLFYTGTIWSPAAICVVSCALGILFWFTGRHEQHCKIQKKWIISLFALLFSVFYVLDQRIVHTGQFGATIDQAYLLPLGKTELGMMVLFAVFVYQLLRSMVVIVALAIEKFNTVQFAVIKVLRQPVAIKHFQLGAFVVLLASWSVCWLTYFPGTGMNDTLWIWQSPLTSSVQHTLAYNYLMYGFMYLGNALGGSWSWGVALYTLVQLVFCAWTVSYVLNWLAKRNVPQIFVVLILMFFAASRIVANISIQSVKDTIFSFNLLLLIPLLFDCAASEGKSLTKPKNLVLFLAVSALTVLIRNNGIFVMAGVAVFVVIVCRKRWKSMMAICLIAAIVPYATDAVLMKTVVKREKIAVESFGVPLQQMAAVVARGGTMSEEEAAIMNTIMPLEELKTRYRPTTADTLKWGEGAKYLNKTWIAENTGLFLKTWASMLVNNLDIYIEAYLLGTISYWNVGEPSMAQGLYYTYPKNASISLVIEQQRVLPEAIHQSLQKYYRMNEKTESPSGGTMIWLTLVLMVYLCCTGQNRKTLCFLPAVIVWGTVMISAPIAYGFRYLFALYLACPFLVITPLIAMKKA